MLRDENKWSNFLFFFFNLIAFRSLYSSTRTEKKEKKKFHESDTINFPESGRV